MTRTILAAARLVRHLRGDGVRRSRDIAREDARLARAEASLAKREAALANRELAFAKRQLGPKPGPVTTT